MTALPETADPIEPPGFRHETVFYREDEDFLRALVPYVRDGLEHDEAVVAAAPPVRLGLLRDALSDDAGAVEFLDMTDVGANPARIIAAWEDAVARTIGAGRGLRGIGEPAYPGRRGDELAECELHELLLDRAFDGGPRWRLLCPYDERRLPAQVCASSAAIHPLHMSPDGTVRPSGRPDPDVAAAFGTPLPAAPPDALRQEFAVGDVGAVRALVAGAAHAAGLSEEQVETLRVAASELATNSVRHGGGSGTLSLWTSPEALVVEVADRGRITDPLTGRRAPAPDEAGRPPLGGYGIYLVNQLCDLVQLRSSDAGTTVRVTTWR